jgi:hypothetical protein
MNSDAPSVDLAEVEARMRPGRFSQLGFLGPDERLEDVLARDARAVAEHGLTFATLARALERLVAAAEAARGLAVHIAPHFETVITAYKGLQMCPWSPDPHHAQCSAGSGVRYASLEWRIRNLRTNHVMSGPGLAVHLIRDHHFCEGVQSPYRVDPLELAHLLEVPTTEIPF